MEIWLTADTHYSHANVIRYCGRPYDTVEAMDEALETLHNELVKPGDQVWMLGDIVMGKRDQTLSVIARLHGDKHLISGNHDHTFAGNKRQAAGIAQYTTAGFASIADTGVLDVAGRTVGLHHFPYAGDSHDTDRYAEFRPADRGGWLLHGHVHDAWRQRGRMVNVGVDAWAMRPVHLDEVRALIDAGARYLDPLPHR